VNEIARIIETFSPEELWMFRLIGGRLPFGMYRRGAAVGTLEAALDAMVQHERGASGIWRERTKPEQPPNALLDVKVA
jgi:hypothetical protein